MRTIMSEARPTRLLTTRRRTAFAIGVTGFILSLTVRGGLHIGHTQPGWLLPIDYLLHGWALIAANVAFYLYLCWIAFCFIRGSEGREQIFMAGWCTHLMLYPVEKLWPLTDQAIQYIGSLALAISILAAVSLLVHPAPVPAPRALVEDSPVRRT
jgi:hypothetical protein